MSDEDGPPKKRVRWESTADGTANETIERYSEELTEIEDTEEERGEKISLAITQQNNRIGCAYYDPAKLTIYVLEDMLESPQLDMTTMLIEQVEPNIVLTSSKVDDPFMDILRKSMEDVGGLFQIRPAKDFTTKRGRDRLLSLNLLLDLPVSPTETMAAQDSCSSDSTANAYDFMRKRIDVTGDPTLQRWNASIRMANFASFEQAPLCLSSIGALLDHLTRERAVGDLGEEGIGSLEINGIQIFSLDQVMHINYDALHSLQVFEEENHASVHSDKSKEGLSLYGILNNTKTTLGRHLLRQWLLRPLLSLSKIKSRHNAVECFVHPENIATADILQQHLAKIRNVPRILAALKTGKHKLKDWQGLVVFCLSAAMIRDGLGELNQFGGIDIAKKLVEVLDVGMFRDVGAAINDTIDWEESANSGRVCVRQHIDEELDNRKHIYAGIDTVLSKVAEQISLNTPENISSLNVVYFPQLGFLICTPLLEEWRNRGSIEVHDGWAFQFSSDAHVYFKSQEMRDMDAHIGDLHSSIVDREIEIVEALYERIVVYDQAISTTCEFCAELDCLLSFAIAARTYSFTRPQMSEENLIQIVQGRHPLQELIVDTFVPNDAMLVGGGAGSIRASFDGSDEDEANVSSVIVCTGANACGKSVYLKQVALIQYMAQIGCFVPAQSATLGIVDKVFTRVQTRESVSKAQSAFMIDLNQVSLALRNCTARSLVLLDEFGKGTKSTDGAALFCGVIKHLLNRGSSCPKVLVATHFHQVNADILSSPELSISFVHMQVMFTTSLGTVLATDSSTTGDYDDEAIAAGLRPGDKITYLYRVAKGLARHSHAAKCAELCGLSRSVVERAQHVTDLYTRHELGRLLDEEMSKEEASQLQTTEAVCREFLAWNLQDSQAPQVGSTKLRLAEVLGRQLF